MRFSRFKVISAVIFTTLSLFLTPVFAWNENGHLLVAKIAYEKLKPEARVKIDRLITYLHQEYADINTFPQAAVWADKLRGQQLDVYTHWHYIDQTLAKDGGNPNVNIIDTDNAMWAIEKIRGYISNEKANPFERARLLAFLIHILGDIHQPLHTVALVTPKFPAGDRGGNDYIVTYKNKHSNLHKVWDGGVGAFDHRYSDTDETCNAEVNTQAEAIAALYPPSYFADRLKQGELRQWLKEGLEIADKYVYSSPENQPLSTAYLQQGSAIAEQQVALAGYRLAEMLNQLFS